jgi:hypothetical protein
VAAAISAEAPYYGSCGLLFLLTAGEMKNISGNNGEKWPISPIARRLLFWCHSTVVLKSLSHCIGDLLQLLLLFV